MQRRTWYRAWQPLVSEILALPKFHLVLNGDIVDLDVKKRNHPSIAHNHIDILQVAYNTLEPLVDAAQSIMISQGTDAHVGTEAVYEEMLAKLIDKKYPGKIKSPSETALTSPHIKYQNAVTEKKYDIAHHAEAGPGKSQASQATFPVRIGVQVHNRYAKAHKPPPDFVIRGHYHFPAVGNYGDMQIFCLPAWQWATEFVFRMGGAEIMAQHGALIGTTMRTFSMERQKQWLKL